MMMIMMSKEDNGLVSRNSSHILYYYCYHDSTKCRLFFPFPSFFFRRWYFFPSLPLSIFMLVAVIQPSWPWPLRNQNQRPAAAKPDTHKYVYRNRSVNWGDEKKSTRKKSQDIIIALYAYGFVFVWAFSKQSSWLLKCEGVSKVEGNAKCYALHVSAIL